MSPRLNKSHLIVSVLAAVVVLVGFVTQSLLGDASYPFRIAMWVSISIIVFYFLGVVIRYYLISSVFMIDLELAESEEEVSEAEMIEEAFPESESIEAETQEDMIFEDPVGIQDESFFEPVPLGDDIK